MKFATWLHDGLERAGVVDGAEVFALPEGKTVLALTQLGLAAALEVGEEALSHSRSVPLEQVRLLPPLKPPSVRDFVTFEEHVEGISASVDGASEVVPEWYQAPTFYFTNPHTVIGTESVLAPPVTERLDFELEVAAVIGGPDGKNLDGRLGREAIFGYTIMNDWSARDLQSREMKVRLGPSKGKDFATSLGPWIVTSDELNSFEDADGFLEVRAEVRVNGALIGEDLVSNMGWPFGELVAYASRNSRVVAGDVLGSGTVGNGGCLGEIWGRRGELIPSPLQEGDEVRMTVEGIGELVNRIGAPESAPGVLPARSRPRPRPRRRLDGTE